MECLADEGQPKPESNGDEGYEDAAEDLDPRIQIELEKLNSSTDVINKLELDLEEARSTFRHLLDESGRHLNRFQKEIGPSVEKARPYYEARMKARIALAEAQHAAARFEKASGAHEAAKEMVTLAEEGFQERGVVHFDQAWQEMLNHATTRVNESEVERNLSEDEHRIKSRDYQDAERKVISLQKSLKRSINKSRPYFEAKARLNQSLDDQKRQIQVIEETIQMTKNGYSDSLKELERISEEIHERRRRQKDCPDGVRQAGVGAEFPSPSPIEKKLKQTIQRQKSLVLTSTPLKPRSPSVSSSSTESHEDVSSSSNSSPEKSSAVTAYERLTDDSKAAQNESKKAPKSKLANKYLTVKQEEDFSDADSLASMEMMDDDQIDQLMKETSLQETAEELVSNVVVRD